MNEKKTLSSCKKLLHWQTSEIEGEVPVGALVTLEGKVIGRG